MDETQLLTVIVVGCGNIAGGFDIGLNNENGPFTHLGAYTRDGRFDVICCIDPDDKKRTEFQENWGIKNGYSSIEEAIDSGLSADIVSICSPTSSHRNDVILSLKFQPKLVFCEKPVTENCKETMKVIEVCRSRGVALMINHTRRWDPSIQKFKSDMASNKYGELRSVVGFYNKGVLNNGSHLLDLLLYFFDDLELLSVGEGQVDYLEKDPTISALLKTNVGTPIHLVTAHALDYSMFELKFVFEFGVLDMREGGQSWSWRSVEKSTKFKNYRTLNNEDFFNGTYEQAMLEAVGNIYLYLTSGASLASTGETALQAQILCEQMVQCNEMKVEKKI